MLEIKKHRIILLQILKEIFSTIDLGTLLGFKGGTACYFFYELPRFSVDLDFDLLDPLKELYVLKKIETILEKYGKLKDISNKHNTLFFLLSYEAEFNNIKIEISKRNFNSKYSLKEYLGIPMFVMVKEDMFAHKLVSMTERKKLANRDLFDVWFFLKKNWDFNPEIIKNRKKQEIKSYLKDCVEFIEKVNNTHLLVGMGELLTEELKQFVKINLKKELLFLLQLRIDSL